MAAGQIKSDIDHAALVRKAYAAGIERDKLGVAKVGQPAPDFAALTSDGKPFKLSAAVGKKPIAIYFAAYQAEIIRGGLQSVPAGQNEAAEALGIPYHHRMAHVLLPQAFRNALPATINQFVICFMETSLVVIVGFFDLLASGNAAYRTGEWTFAFVEVYVFIAAIYFVFSFGLSQYGSYLERRMGRGKH